jgi:hypothetical protein
MPLPPEVRRDRRAAVSRLRDPKPIIRRPCKNCDKKFNKIRPNHIFCSAECKDEYRRYGSAFGPLKQFLIKLIEKSAGERAAAATAEQFAAYVTGKGFRRHLVDSGFVHRSMLRKRPTHLSATALRASIRELEARLATAEHHATHIGLIIHELVGRLERAEMVIGPPERPAQFPKPPHAPPVKVAG